MTQAQVKPVVREFAGKTSKELFALAQTSPAKIPAIVAHAEERLASLRARGCENPYRLGNWSKLVALKAGKAKPAKKAELTKAEILAQLATLQAALADAA